MTNVTGPTGKLTAAEQDELILLHDTSPELWRKKITKVIRDNPLEYKIFELGDNMHSNNHVRHLTTSQFNNILPNYLKQDLVSQIFNDIDNNDDKKGDGQLQIPTIIRWVNQIKKQKTNSIIKDENWIFNILRTTQFVDFDIDGNGVLDKNEFQQHFGNSITNDMLDIVFNVIDKNGDGEISIMEFFQWQKDFTKKEFTDLFTKNVSGSDQKSQTIINTNTDAVADAIAIKKKKSKIS